MIKPAIGKNRGEDQLRDPTKLTSASIFATYMVGNLDNQGQWLRIINLMEHFRGTCGSEVVSCQHSLQSESGR